MTYFPKFDLTQELIEPLINKFEKEDIYTRLSYSTTIRFLDTDDNIWYRMRVGSVRETAHPELEMVNFLKEAIELSYVCSYLGKIPNEVLYNSAGVVIGDKCPIQITEKTRLLLLETMKHEPLNTLI